jgi:hypothetical protein
MPTDKLSGDHARDTHRENLGDDYARDTHYEGLGDDYARDGKDNVNDDDITNAPEKPSE